MKRLSKRLVVITLLALLAPIITPANALIIQHYKAPKGLTTDGSSYGEGNSDTEILGVSSPNEGVRAECKGAGDYLSWETLENIMNPKENFRVEKEIVDNKVNLRVYIPSHPKDCLDLDVEIQRIKTDPKNGFFVKVKNRFFSEEPKFKSKYGDTIKKRFGEDAYKKLGMMSQNEKLKWCFQKLAKKNKNGQMVLSLGEDDYTTFSGPFRTKSPIEVKDVNDVYAYMKVPQLGYKQREIKKDTTLPPASLDNDSCFRVENFNLENKNEPILDFRMLADKMNFEGCDGTEACVEKHMNQFFKVLQDEDMVKQLTQAHIKELEKILFGEGDDKNYNNVRDKMKEIIDELTNLAEEITEEDIDDVSPMDKDYDELLHKLDKNYMQPLKDILEIKYKMYSSANESEREEINKSIETINNLLGMYKDESVKAAETAIVFAENNRMDKAKRIGKVLSISENFSHVKKSGDERISFRRAVSQFKRDQKRIRRDLKTAKKIYNVKRGKTKMSPTIRAKMKTAESGYTTYMQALYKKEQELYAGCQTNWYGGMKDKAACQRFQQGYQTRAKQRQLLQQNHNKRMSAYTNELRGWSKYEMLGSRYLAAKKAERYGSSTYDGRSSSLINFGLFGDSFGSTDYYDDSLLYYTDDSLMFNDVYGGTGGFSGNFGNVPGRVY